MSLVKRDLDDYEDWRFEKGRVCPLCETQVAPVPYEVTPEQLELDPDMDWGDEEYCGVCQHSLYLLSKND
jgi:uncharacterized protein YuzB (UPF0349 family)